MRRRGTFRILSEEEFARTLKSMGLKATDKRLALHRVMTERIHAGADEVRSLLQSREGVSISRSTVYDLLSELADRGIYARRFSPCGKMVFDANATAHVHLYDTRNDVFMDIDGEQMLQAVEGALKGRRFRGYKTDGIELQVLCHPTRKKLI